MQRIHELQHLLLVLHTEVADLAPETAGLAAVLVVLLFVPQRLRGDRVPGSLAAQAHRDPGAFSLHRPLHVLLLHAEGLRHVLPAHPGAGLLVVLAPGAQAADIGARDTLGVGGAPDVECQRRGVHLVRVRGQHVVVVGHGDSILEYRGFHKLTPGGLLALCRVHSNIRMEKTVNMQKLGLNIGLDSLRNCII